MIPSINTVKICKGKDIETGEILPYIKYLYNNTEHFIIQYFEVELFIRVSQEIWFINLTTQFRAG